MPGGRYPWAVRAGGPLLGGGAPTPPALEDLTFWNDLQDAATITIGVGDEITNLADKSGNGYDVSPTGQPGPVLSSDSGFVSAFYDGTKELARTGIGQAGFSGNWTLFYVYRATDVVTRLLGRITNLTTGEFDARTASTGITSFATPGSFLSTGIGSDNALSFMILRVDSNVAHDFIDDGGNTATKAFGVGDITTLDAIEVGFSAGQDPSTRDIGHIFEAGAYSIALDAATRGELITYFIAKYGIGIPP